jgi:hypothetical protein
MDLDLRESDSGNISGLALQNPIGWIAESPSAPLATVRVSVRWRAIENRGEMLPGRTRFLSVMREIIDLPRDAAHQQYRGDPRKKRATSEQKKLVSYQFWSMLPHSFVLCSMDIALKNSA